MALDRVLFVPTRQPPHKSAKELLPGDARLRLIELAIRDQPAFVASDIELRRPGASYTIDTVSALHRQLPSAKLFLLIGEDMLSVRWLAWEALKRQCTIVVARRPGSRGRRLERGLRWLAMPQLEIASSDIRSRLRAGRSIRYLVPSAVERHIREHGLFRRSKEG